MKKSDVLIVIALAGTLAFFVYAASYMRRQVRLARAVKASIEQRIYAGPGLSVSTNDPLVIRVTREAESATNQVWFVEVPGSPNMWKVRSTWRFGAMSEIGAIVWSETEWNEVSNHLAENAFEFPQIIDRTTRR